MTHAQPVTHDQGPQQIDAEEARLVNTSQDRRVIMTHPNQAAYVKHTPQLPYHDPSPRCIPRMYCRPLFLALPISSALCLGYFLLNLARAAMQVDDSST